MAQHDVTPEIPKQEVGAETNLEATETLTDLQAAKDLYKLAKSRLLNVNLWHELCGKLSTDFTLTDEKGAEVSGIVQVNDHFKIDIPGPGTKSGEGYDWVQVEKIEEKTAEAEDSESIVMTVRPAENPLKKDGNIAHFFSGNATSNFTLIRKGNTLSAAVHGRNEVPNTSADNLIDKARNTIVGLTALAGMSSPQWSKLVHAWLGK